MNRMSAKTTSLHPGDLVHIGKQITIAILKITGTKCLVRIESDEHVRIITGPVKPATTR
jgi:sRNA-binding carbon storage regulator CsrA